MVVDDSTPLTDEYLEVIDGIKNLSTYNANLVYLRTPENKLKSGALNLGINYISKYYPIIQTAPIFPRE